MQYLYVIPYITDHKGNENPSTVGEDYISTLMKYRMAHPKNLITCHLNINSVRNKFPEVAYILQKNVTDILFLSETKLDSSFPLSQFCAPGFKSVRADRNEHGGEGG